MNVIKMALVLLLIITCEFVSGQDNADFHWEKAVAFYKDGKYDKALEEYDKALFINPNHIKSLMGSARAYIQLKDYKEAGILYEKVVMLQPDSYGAYTDLGNSYAINEEHEKAITCYKKALEINSTSTVALLGLGKSYAALNKDKEAREYFGKVMQWSKPDGMLYKQATEEIEKLNAKLPPTKGPVLDYKGYKE